MKVYEVWHGEYDDRQLLGTFSSEAGARALADIFDGTEVEERWLDPWLGVIAQGVSFFQVWMHKDGKARVDLQSRPVGLPEEGCQSRHDVIATDDGGVLIVLTFALDGVDAVRIADEQRVLLLRAGAWPQPLLPMVDLPTLAVEQIEADQVAQRQRARDRIMKPCAHCGDNMPLEYFDAGDDICHDCRDEADQ